MRYYQANAGGDNYTGSDNVPSGAYIFKPAKDKQYSMPYTSLVKQESFNLNFMQQTNLYFRDPDTNRSARVLVRAFAKNPALEFEVTLDPIPASLGG